MSDGKANIARGMGKRDALRPTELRQTARMSEKCPRRMTELARAFSRVGEPAPKADREQSRRPPIGRKLRRGLSSSIAPLRAVLAALPICLCYCSAALAGDVKLRVSSRETYVGEPVRVDIIVSNAETHEPPVFPDLEGASVRPLGGVSESSHISIINGRMTRKVSSTYPFAITPTQAGTITVPPIMVRVDAEDQTVPGFKIIASKSETGDLLFAEIAADRDSIYLGESLELVLRIWVKPYRDRGFKLTLTERNMWDQIDVRNGRWGAFADPLEQLLTRGRRPQGREVLREDSDGRQRSYYLYEIKTTLWPEAAGTLDAADVGDVAVKVSYPQRLERDRRMFSMGNLRIAATRPLIVPAVPGPVEVKPVPTDGRPPWYNGAVGRFGFAVTAKPTDVHVGDPITLTMSVSALGSGSRPVLNLLQAPKLEAIDGLTEQFKIPDEMLAGELQGTVKRFTQTIRARSDGVEAVPPIPFTYFDTRSEQFVTLRSNPIPITVAPADRIAVSTIVESDAGTATSARLTRRREGILANYTDIDELLATHSFAPGRGALAWILAPPLLTGVIALGRRRSERLKHDVAYASRRGARSTALRSLARARSSAGPTEEAALVLGAITQYVADRSGSPAVSLTRAEAVRRLRDGGVAEDKAAATDRLLELCESLQYSAGADAGADGLACRGRRCIYELEKERF